MSKYSNHSLIRLSAVFFIVFFMLSVVNIQAQDTPTDVPTDTATVVPTDVPTELPTAAPTEAPTDVPTEVPTEAATEAPTAAPTEATETPVVVTQESSPVPSDTPAPTALAPEPPMTVLVNESFDNGDVSPWAPAAGWSLVPSETGLAWQVVNSNAPLNLLKGGFLNVAVQARFILQSGAAQLIVRQSAVGNYTASIDASGIVGLYRAGVAVQTVQLAPVTSGTWRTLRLSVVDGVLRVAVDNVEVIAVADAQQLPPGSAAIAGNFVIPTDGSAAPQNTFLADDFWLLVKTDDANLYPSPTGIPTAAPTEATATETPAATQESSPVPSETAAPTTAPEAALTLLVSDNFDSGDTAAWASVAGWSLVPSENGLAWQVVNTNQALNSLKGDFLNVAVQARFLQQGGAAQLIVRQSAAGNYTASVDTSGIVGLYRAGVLLQQTQAPASAAGAWRTLRLSAVDGVLRVSVDGTEVIVVTDAEQLPPGSVAIGANFLIPTDGSAAPQNTFLADDFSMWVKADEVTSPSAPATETATPAAPTATVEAPTAEPTFTGKNLNAVPQPSAALLASLGPLSNDDFVNREVIPSTNPLVAYAAVNVPVGTTDTTGAGMETNEGQPVGCNSALNVGHSVWFEFTPSVNASYTISTAGSNYDTVIGIYTGTTVNGLTLVACNDDASVSTFTSLKTLALTTANTYMIQISGFNNSYGIYNLRVTQVGVPVPLAAPVLTAPIDNFYTNNASIPLPNLTWNAVVANTHHYEIQIDDSALFTIPLVQTNANIPQGVSPISYTVSPNLTGTAGTIYYWRVRALNSSGAFGPWSLVRKIIVDTVAPLAPNLLLPAVNATVPAAKPVFTWTAAVGANGYLVDIDKTDCTFGDPFVTDAAVVGATFTPLTSLPQGTYCWRVQAKDAAGNIGAESTPRSFSIFIGTAPVNNFVAFTVAPATTANVTFTWTAVAGASSYTLYVRLAGTCTVDAVAPITGLTVLTKVVSALPQGNYCWKVQAVGVDTGVPPTVRNFTITPPAAAAPVLSAPAIGALTSNTHPNFTWIGSVSTLGTPYTYELQVDNNGCLFPSPEIGQTGLPLTYTPGGALADGVYCWRVRTVNTFGVPGAWSATRSFTLDTTAPLAPNLLLPAVNATVSAAKPVFTWTAAVGANGYLVDVDKTDCTFGNLVVTNAPVVAATFTPATSLPQGTYCWRVQSRDAAGNTGAESTPRSFSIFIGTAPVNNFVAVTVAPATTANVTFTWTAVAGASSYTLYVRDAATCTNELGGGPFTGLTVLTKVVSALPQGNYCWKVEAVGIDPAGAPPTLRNFTITPAAAVAPVLTAPAIGAVSNNPIPVFTWIGSVSALGTPYTYELQVDNNGCLFPSPEIGQTGLPLTYTPPGALADGVYCWRVRTVNKFNVPGAWSATRSFTIDTAAPLAPNLLLPAVNATVSAAKPVFTWTAAVGANGYLVDVDKVDCNFNVGDLVVTNAPVVAATFTPATSLPQGTYCWRVQSKDAAGNIGVESTPRSFSIFIGTAPVNNLVVVTVAPATTANVTFTWAAVVGASSYTLYVRDAATCAIDAAGPFTGLTVLTKVVSALPQGNYCWKVQAVGVDAGAPPTVRNFTITPAGALAPVLSAPAIAAVTSNTTPTFTWIASTSVAGSPYTYELQADNNGCLFPSPEIGQTGLPLTYTPGIALANGVYCWRVRTVNKFNVPGPWSATRSFTVDVVNPAVPVLLLPADNASVSVNPPTFTWAVVPGATRYDFKYGVTSTPNITVSVVASAAPSFKPVSPLLNNTYYWQVEAFDAAGNRSGLSAVRSVKIISAVNAVPVLNRFGASPIVLTWGPISWVTNGGHYELVVDNNTTFLSPEFQNLNIGEGIQSLSIPVPATPNLVNGTWYWHVRACNAANACGAWSTYGTFTLDF